MSIMFNEVCINEEMLPKYTYIYISLQRVEHSVDKKKSRYSLYMQMD